MAIYLKRADGRPDQAPESRANCPVLRYRHRVPDVRVARVDRGKLHYSLGSHARAHSFIENVPSLRLRFRVLVYGGSAEGTSRSRSYETLTEQKPRGLSTRALAGAAVA